jgi:hypothetical protein
VNLLNTQRVSDKEAPADWPPAADSDAHSPVSSPESSPESSPVSSIDRRRFWRVRQSNGGQHAGAGESLESLQAELVVLREENARLKASQHQQQDLARLLGRARDLPAPEAHRDGVADEAAQMLVEGLVIREAMVEICQEIERSMVVFEAKLDALGARPPIDPRSRHELANGHDGADSELRLAPATAEIESTNGDGPGNA